ncbi:iron complex transport system substrate-binding protein [Rhodobacter sp. JA431]|uniref:heme/hemin ABC transporter substrate-binding protein n=1 Tax=Rhodobacter sp. JA431 TaxID=570013 RepID=UPI000BD3B924|nr:ABC transporter substrate-binding protein [Rhodobacter sp. JA431]SOC09803.1 iron complex transport system substrate-binding protein [Rhodobacter sp. JA431]
MTRLFLALLLAFAPLAVAAQERVLSIGGSLTEVVVALGQEARLVGRDTTSTYPETVTDLPDVGYMRQLSPEGVLSVRPDLILLTEGAGPPETLATLRSAGVDLVTVAEGHSPEAVNEKIRAVAQALGVAQDGEVLAARVADEIAAARAAAVQASGRKPRVLFLLSNSGGRLTGAGTDTAAQAMIALAGGENALTGFAGYKALTDEAIASAAPDVLLVMERGAAGPQAKTDYLSHPAITATPAGQAGRVVQMEGMFLLGFGPRTGQAIAALHGALYPEPR